MNCIIGAMISFLTWNAVGHVFKAQINPKTIKLLHLHFRIKVKEQRIVGLESE
jgi:hypothetical protein